MADAGDDRSQDGGDWIAVAVDWSGLGVAQWRGWVGRCRWPVDAADRSSQLGPRGPNGADGRSGTQPEAHGRTAIGLGRTGNGAQVEHGKDARRMPNRLKRNYQLPDRHPVCNGRVPSFGGGQVCLAPG